MYHAVEPLLYSDHSVYQLVVFVFWSVSKLLSHDPGACAPPLLLILVSSPSTPQQVRFLHQRTHVRTHSLQVVHICVYVYMCVYAFICTWMHLCVYDIAWHVEALLLRFLICAYVRICMRMYMCVHVCVYRCTCICICMSVYMWAYTFIYTRVWVYICTRVGALCLFVLFNLSTTFACITCVS